MQALQWSEESLAGSGAALTRKRDPLSGPPFAPLYNGSLASVGAGAAAATATGLGHGAPAVWLLFPPHHERVRTGLCE